MPTFRFLRFLRCLRCLHLPLKGWAFCLLAAFWMLSAAPTWAAAPARTAARPSCSWDSPGTNPYRGELAAAVDHYSDIPAATRAALKARITAQRYDDIAVIGRGHITGQWHYGAELRDMHFGNGTVCRSVTRKRWAAQAEERGLVYCEAGHCVIVPTVCRNVSRVVRRQAVAAAPPPEAGVAGIADAAGQAGMGGMASAASGTQPPAPAATQTLALLPEGAELQFEAPSAGRAYASGVDALPWTGPTDLLLAGPAIGAPDAATLLKPAPSEPLAHIGSGGAAGVPGTAPGAAPAFTPPVAQPLDPYLPSPGGGGLLPSSPSLPLPPTAPVPEPGTALLFTLGLAALARRAARKKSA